MSGAFSHLTNNPLVALYILQSLTYLTAAILSRQAGHTNLCLCYSTSAMLHGGFAGCHLMHLGG
jgi:hypothetical protein